LLPPLAYLSFVLGMQVSAIQAFAGEEYLPSQEDLTHAIQQAKKIQEEANSLIHKGNLLQGEKHQNGCASQLAEGKLVPTKPGQGQSKGCFRNKAPSTPQHTSQNDASSPQRDASQKEKGSQNLVPAKAGILVFVSFSMPEASLKSLAQEAQRTWTRGDASQQHHAVLVMRGLYQDSFVKTASKIQELGIAVDIHPELFETHHVTSVPTFVRLEDGQPIHSLKGNVTLDFVVKAFEDQEVEEAP
jgi:type-F conjugative transfer system pilin assembly protein TrbC